MALGLNRDEIKEILIKDFDREVEERYDGPDEHLSLEKFNLAIMVLRDRMEDAIIANNKRLSEQLKHLI